jgi:hypothetical protein
MSTKLKKLALLSSYIVKAGKKYLKKQKKRKQYNVLKDVSHYIKSVGFALNNHYTLGNVNIKDGALSYMS